MAEQADNLRARGLVDICAACIEAEHRPVPRTPTAIIRAAFSTNALSVALTSTADKLVLDGYGDTPPSWEGFANKVSVKDFKTAKVIRPSWSGELQELADGGEIDHGHLEESYVDVSAAVFAQMFAVSYQSMVNDDGQVFAQAASALGKNAMRKVSDEVYTVLLANADDFFHADNSNLLTGADSALSIASIGDAVAAMISQRDANGRDLDIHPTLLLVPPELRTIALQIVQSEEVARYVSAQLDNLPTGNAFKSLTLAVEPRLSNSDRFAGTSETAFYLFSRPADGALNLAFLDGVQNPTIEFFGLDAEASRLGYSWRVHHSFGAGLGDARAAIKSNGV